MFSLLFLVVSACPGVQRAGVRAAIVLFTAALGLGCTAPTADFEKASARIMGGAPSTYPQVLSLRARDISCGAAPESFPFCTAVQITRNVALTAAHCLQGSSAYSLELAAGADAEAPLAVSSVQRVVAHPEYDPSVRTTDLGLIVFDGTALPPAADLAIAAPKLGTETVTLVGYGLSELPDQTVQRSGSANVVTVNPENFEMTPAPANACQGDSGGAVLNASGELVGLIRSGDNACMEFTKGVRVDRHWDSFIKPWVDRAARGEAPQAPPPWTNTCELGCERDADCPAGFVCTEDSTGRSLCAHPSLGEPSQLATRCSGHEQCWSNFCVAVPDNDSCSCLTPCTPPDNARGVLLTCNASNAQFPLHPLLVLAGLLGTRNLLRSRRLRARAKRVN